jgi:hypothetical protein
MKLTVRALVLVLAITGAAATTLTAAASTQTKVAATRVSLLPIPVCPPDDPNACGITLGHK